MATNVALAIAKARSDVASHFMSRNAVSPDSAVPYKPERHLRRQQFGQLLDAGVIQPGERGGYYLDVPAYDRHTRTRRRRTGAMIGAALAITGAMLAVFS